MYLLFFPSFFLTPSSVLLTYMYRRKNFQARLIANDDKEMRDKDVGRGITLCLKRPCIGDSSCIGKGF
jgi:hypothetical protein